MEKSKHVGKKVLQLLSLEKNLKAEFKNGWKPDVICLALLEGKSPDRDRTGKLVWDTFHEIVPVVWNDGEKYFDFDILEDEGFINLKKKK